MSNRLEMESRNNKKKKIHVRFIEEIKLDDNNLKKTGRNNVVRNVNHSLCHEVSSR